jgi:hypothetical protein
MSSQDLTTQWNTIVMAIKAKNMLLGSALQLATPGEETAEQFTFELAHSFYCDLFKQAKHLNLVQAALMELGLPAKTLSFVKMKAQVAKVAHEQRQEAVQENLSGPVGSYQQLGQAAAVVPVEAQSVLEAMS